MSSRFSNGNSEFLGRKNWTLLQQGVWRNSLVILDSIPPLEYQIFTQNGPVELPLWAWKDMLRDTVTPHMPKQSINWQFRSDDFPDPMGLVPSFYDSHNRVTAHILSRFSEKAQEKFTNSQYSSGNHQKILDMLVRELNALIEKKSLYDPVVFKDGVLSEHTKDALGSFDHGENTIPVNRGLFEDLFIRPWFDQWGEGDPQGLQVCVQWMWNRLYGTVEEITHRKRIEDWASRESAIEQAMWVTAEDLDRMISGGQFSCTDAFFHHTDIQELNKFLSLLANPQSPCDHFLHEKFLEHDVPLPLIEKGEVRAEKWLSAILKCLNSLLPCSDWGGIDRRSDNLAIPQADEGSAPGADFAHLQRQKPTILQNREWLEQNYASYLRGVDHRTEQITWGVFSGRLLRKQLKTFEWKGYVPCKALVQKTWYRDCLDVLKKTLPTPKGGERAEEGEEDPNSIPPGPSPLEIKKFREALIKKDYQLAALSEELRPEAETPPAPTPCSEGQEGQPKADRHQQAWRRRTFVEHIRVFLKIRVAKCNPNFQNSSEEEIAECRMLSLAYNADMIQLVFSAKALTAFLIKEGQISEDNFYQIKGRLRARLQPLIPWFYRKAKKAQETKEE